MDQIEAFGAKIMLMPATKFEIMDFDSFEDMEEYARDKDTFVEEGKPGICFGFALEQDNSNYNAKMFYSDS